jgi:hypothetical protein
VNKDSFLGQLSGQVVDAMAVTLRKGKPPVAARLRRSVRRLNREALFQLREFVAAETFSRATNFKQPIALRKTSAIQGINTNIDQRELFELATAGWDELRLPYPSELRPAKAHHPLRPPPHHRPRQPHY